MITKEIKLCGKQVTLAYNYATEISYKILSDEDITDFIAEVIECMNSEPQRMPDVRKTIFLILAAMNAYYDDEGNKAPVSDKDLIKQASPQDVGLALGTIISLRTQFYHVPSDEPEDKEPKGKRKKGKNA